MSQPSKIILDEAFRGGDGAFLRELRKFNSASFLANFVDTWLKDDRPWARQQVIDYVLGDLNLPGHEVVFKRLFKHFESAADDEVMSSFMVALDRLVRRRLVRRWDYTTGRTTVRLFAAPNKTVMERDASFKEETNSWTGRKYKVLVPAVVNDGFNNLFSQRTRNYLRRRVWRYFRQLSFRSPERYRAAMVSALKLYRDTDFAQGENIIDNWSLMHACYFRAPELRPSTSHVQLVSGKSLATLTATPFRSKVWNESGAFEPLLNLLTVAQSTLIRGWASELLDRGHAPRLSNIPIELLSDLLGQPESRIQAFSTALFQRHESLASLTVSQWLDLVHKADPKVLSTVCDGLKKHVAEERLEVDQLVELALAAATPVAQLGLDFLQQRHERQSLPSESLLPLADLQSEAVADQVGKWTVAILGTPDRYDVETATNFLDSPLEPIRAAWFAWLNHPDSPGGADATLWTRLLQSPYDDIRYKIIRALGESSTKRGRDRATNANAKFADDAATEIALVGVWKSVLFNVHRGSRVKPKAIQQMTQAIADVPARAEQLLPIVAIALRSVRLPERHSALAAIVTMAGDDPQMREQVSLHVPELRWMKDGEATKNREVLA